MPSTSTSPSSRRSPNWLRHPLVWIAVVCAALMGGLITSSYIGGLVDPVGHLQDAPIGFVNADPGVTVGATQLDAGSQIQDQVTGTGDGRIDWQVLDSQAEAERRIRDDDLWGAVVVPNGFSAAVAGMASAPTTAKAAELVILTNEGAGLFQPSFFSEVSDEAVAATSSSVRQQLVGLLDQGGTTLPADAAAVIGNPVVADETAVVALPAKAGRGIAPFYLTVMITLSGFLAASIVGVGLDLLRGSDRLELLGRPVELRPGGHERGSLGAGAPQAGDDIRPLRLWVAKAFPTLVAAVLAGLAAVFAALVLFGMDVSSAPKAYAVGALGSAAVAMISLWFLTLFGIAGELVGVLFTTIFGVPAALGIYPYQAVPGVFRFIAAWHPMRFLSDAMRSIAFYGGSGAGLGRGVAVVAAWLVGAIVVGGATAWLLDRRAPAASTPEPSATVEGRGAVAVDTSDDVPAPAPRTT